MNAKFVGMKDMPVEKEKITDIIKQLIDLRDNEERHLSDVGMGLNWAAQNILTISETAFREFKNQIS